MDLLGLQLRAHAHFLHCLPSGGGRRDRGRFREPRHSRGPLHKTREGKKLECLRKELPNQSMRPSPPVRPVDFPGWTVAQ